MLFNSVSFVIFLPIVFVGYFVLPYRFRRFFLLLASCYFYMAFVPKYILILFSLITVDYFLAFAIANHKGPGRWWYLLMSICANLGTLFFFKYFNFFNENVAALAHFLHFNYNPFLLSVALPLGLSFHVFQSLSYVIEVYKGRYEPEKNYITYALYVMFFPQLVAGPIERPAQLLPQLNANHDFDPVRARRGLERMLWGFFKKMVIADQIALIVNPLWAKPPENGWVLAFIAFAFTYQMYCDFSGYTDIALGAAMLFGFDLIDNFNRPFASRSMAEYWRRWHISLSNWLRDYLYYPLALGWGKMSRFRLNMSLLITFILCGVWHGANWTYIAFGTLHGIYLVIESATDVLRKRFFEFVGLVRFPRVLAVLQTVTVFILVSIALVIFRSDYLGQAWWMFTHMFTGLSRVRYALITVMAPVGHIEFAVILFSIILMEWIQYMRDKKKTFFIFDDASPTIRYSWYYILMTVIVIFGFFGAQSFIYFQF